MSDQASMSIPNPRRLATLPDILEALSVLQSHESNLSTSLTNLLSTYEPISASLGNIQSLGPQLDLLAGETRLLHQTVSYTAQTAQHVGGRVQSLDEEMKRVREASERVTQIIELKVYVYHHLPRIYNAHTVVSTVLPCRLAELYRATRLGVCDPSVRESDGATC